MVISNNSTQPLVMKCLFWGDSLHSGLVIVLCYIQWHVLLIRVLVVCRQCKVEGCPTERYIMQKYSETCL